MTRERLRELLIDRGGLVALDHARPGPDDQFATKAHNRYRDAWRVIAIALERAGEAELSARARAHERPWGPTDG